MGNLLSWGWYVCALSVGACSAGAHDSSESGRLSQRGSALELVAGPEIGTGTAVLKQADVGHNPAVASDGSGFLAVQEVDARIRAVRVDAAGKVLDASWLDLGEGTDLQLYPSVAFGAGHYLVTWSASGAQDAIRGRFVRPDGSLEGTAAFTLASGAGTDTSVAWSGSQFLLSWLAFGEPGSGSRVTVGRVRCQRQQDRQLRTRADRASARSALRASPWAAVARSSPGKSTATTTSPAMSGGFTARSWI